MRLTVNPMIEVRRRAERRIDFWYTVTAQDLAHDRKRQLAEAVAAGGAPSAAFVEAAELEGLHADDFAALILEKPDVLMVRENARRALIVAVRQATTPAQVQAILDTAHVRAHPEDRVPGTIGDLP